MSRNARNARNTNNADTITPDTIDAEAEAIIAEAEAETEAEAMTDAIHDEAADALTEALPDDLQAEVAEVRQGLTPNVAPAVEVDDDTRDALARAAIEGVKACKIRTGRWIYATARDGYLNVPNEHWTDRVVELLPNGTCRYGAAVVTIGADGEPCVGATCRSHMMGRGSKMVAPCHWRVATSEDAPRDQWRLNVQQTMDGSAATFIVHVDSDHDGYQRGAVMIEGQDRAFSTLFIASDS